MSFPMSSSNASSETFSSQYARNIDHAVYLSSLESSCVTPVINNEDEDEPSANDLAARLSGRLLDYTEKDIINVFYPELVGQIAITGDLWMIVVSYLRDMSKRRERGFIYGCGPRGNPIKSYAVYLDDRVVEYKSSHKSILRDIRPTYIYDALGRLIQMGEKVEAVKREEVDDDSDHLEYDQRSSLKNDWNTLECSDHDPEIQRELSRHNRFFLKLLSIYVVQQPNLFIQKLWQIVFASRGTQDAGVRIAAANALTLLSILGISFKDMDLSRIQVPGAWIIHTSCEGTHFSGSDLTNVVFKDVPRVRACFVNAILTGTLYQSRPTSHFGAIMLCGVCHRSAHSQEGLGAYADPEKYTIELSNRDGRVETFSFPHFNSGMVFVEEDILAVIDNESRTIHLLDVNTKQIFYDFPHFYSSIIQVDVVKNGLYVIVDSKGAIDLNDYDNKPKLEDLLLKPMGLIGKKWVWIISFYEMAMFNVKFTQCGIPDPDIETCGASLGYVSSRNFDEISIHSKPRMIVMEEKATKSYSSFKECKRYYRTCAEGDNLVDELLLILNMEYFSWLMDLRFRRENPYSSSLWDWHKWDNQSAYIAEWSSREGRVYGNEELWMDKTLSLQLFLYPPFDVETIASVCLDWSAINEEKMESCFTDRSVESVVLSDLKNVPSSGYSRDDNFRSPLQDGFFGASAQEKRMTLYAENHLIVLFRPFSYSLPSLNRGFAAENIMSFLLK